jgi:hypothetical protein
VHPAPGIKELGAFGDGDTVIASTGADKSKSFAPISDVTVKQSPWFKGGVSLFLPLLRQKSRDSVDSPERLESAKIESARFIFDEYPVPVSG